MADNPKFVFPKFHYSLNGNRVLEDLFRGLCGKRHLTIISGEAYVGKTRFALQMAHCMAHGKRFFWSDDLTPQNILYFTERTNESVRRDAQDRNLDMSGVTVVSIQELNDEEYAEYDSNRFKWLKKVIAQYPDHKIVVLDTFGHFLPTYASGKSGMNDYATMARATRELQRLCLRLDVTMFLVHHYAKERESQNYKSFKQRSSGSTSIAGNTLSMWGLEAVGPVDEVSGHSDYIMLSVLYHHGPLPQPVYFRSTEEGILEIVDHSSVIDAMMPKKVPTKHDQVLTLFPDDNPIPRAKLLESMQEKLKMSLPSCYRILAKMVEDGLITVEKTVMDDVTIRKARVQ